MYRKGFKNDARNIRKLFCVKNRVISVKLELKGKRVIISVIFSFKDKINLKDMILNSIPS